MNQVAAVIAQCLASGAVFTSLCAAIIVPSLVWLGVRALTPTIAAMGDDPRWQSTFAAAAALLPGSLFLALVLFGIVDGSSTQCLQYAAGRVMYGLLIVLIAAAIARAIIRARVRNRELHALLAAAKPASGHAAQVAAEVGLALFEIEDERAMLIAASGTPRIGAYASTGVLRTLEAPELRAALFHERAHIDRGDHHIAPWLYFVTDLLPMPLGRLIDIYRCSREFCADHCALEHVERTDLAAALLRVARGLSALPATGAAFAERDAMHGRLDALLRPGADRQANLPRRRFVAVALVSLLALGLALPVAATIFLHCNLMVVS